MANPIRVVGVGDFASMNAELGKATTTLSTFGETSKVAFSAYTESALKAQVASDKLAVSLAKVPEGSTAAAAAMLRYNAELDAMAAKQTAAMKSIGSSMSRYITAPALLVGIAAVKLGTDFQAAMLRIQTQAGASAAEVKNLSGQVLDLAKNGAQQGPTQLAEGLYHLESLGLRGAKAMSALKVSSDAAALGQANLADITTALGGVIVTGIKGSSDFQKTMGTLNATIGAGNLTMSDLVGFLGTGVVPAAKAAGISLTELGAALTVMTDRGIPAEQAGTRLRMTLALLQNQTPKASKALADLGIDSTKIAATLRQPNGLLTVVEMLHAGIASVGKTQGNKDLLAGFGGGRSGSAIQTLVESIDSKTSSLQGKLAQIQAQSGRLTAQESAQSRTAAANFHRDLSAMEADLTALGGAMLPTVTTLVNGLTKIGDAFSALPGPVKQDIGGIVAVLAIGGPLLLAISGTQKAIRSIGTTFGTTAAETTVATATIEGDVAAVGAASTAAAGEVGGLRGALLGLGSSPVLGALAAVALALADINLGHKALTTATAGSFAAGANKSPYQKGSEDDLLYQAGLLGQTGTIKLPGGASINTTNLSAFDRKAYAQGLKKHLVTEAAGITAFGKTFGGELGGTGAGSPGTLTPQQQMQLGLYLDPSDVTLLKQKLAQDNAHIAEAQKLFHEGKISQTKLLAEVQQYGADRATVESEIHAATSKSTSAANKKAAEAAKAQRRYAGGVATRAEGLRTSVSASAGPAGGALSPGRLGAFDALIDFYKAEARDSKLTALERSHYASLAIAARKQEISEAQKAAADYERIAISNAKTAVEKEKQVKGNIAAQETARRHEIQVYETASHNKHLSGTQRATYRQDAGTAKDELSNLRNTYSSPLVLGLDMARATATNDFAGIRAAAEKEKQAAMRAIKSGALGIQGMTDAWDIITQANQTLGQTAAFHTVKMSADKFTAGLGLHGAARREAEMRFAQAMAHGGHTAKYEGIQGIAAAPAPPIHTHLYLDGREIATVVTATQTKLGKHRSVQTRGIHAGHGAL